RRAAEVERVRAEVEVKAVANVGGRAAAERAGTLAHGDARTGAPDERRRGQSRHTATDDDHVRRSSAVHVGLPTETTRRPPKKLQPQRISAIPACGAARRSYPSNRDTRRCAR